MSFKLLHFTKLDGIGRAYFSAGRHEAIFHTVIAQRAFMRLVIALIVTSNHPKGTGDNTVAASIADILLHIDCVELRADNRARWARLLTGRVSAVLAHIALHQPALAIEKRQRCSGW